MSRKLSHAGWVTAGALPLLWILHAGAQAPKPRIVIVATGGTIAGSAESTTAA